MILKIEFHPWYVVNFKFVTNFNKNEAKKFKKNLNGRLKKTEFFKITNSQYFFVKISWIRPWLSRIDWCEGQRCGSTYMSVRLSNISPKTGKKCIFCVFRPFLSLCRIASQPYTLSHINALCINQSYTSKDQSQKFSRKNIENWRSPENDILFSFLVWVFGYLVLRKKYCTYNYMCNICFVIFKSI